MNAPPRHPARHRSHANPVVAPGLLPSILLWPQDCSLQSCCHPRIEGNSTRNSTRATRKKGTCLFPVPNSTRATRKKRDMPVSSSELHAGNSEKKGHACFQFRTPRGQQPKNGWCLFPVRGTSTLVFSSITFLPGVGARPRLPGIEASCRAKVGILPRKKNVEVVV